MHHRPGSVEDLIAEALSRRGWITLRDFITPALAHALREEVLAERARRRLRPAHIGRGAGRVRRADIRGDRIRWLDWDTPPQRRLFARLERLRVTLNRTLFLGLADFEAHYALYPPGARYRRHVDGFHRDNPRRLSLVIYLNPDWRAADGGRLRLYAPQGGRLADIPPEAGRAACFLSEDFPHEVLPARRERLSIACWFRVRAEAPLLAAARRDID